MQTGGWINVQFHHPPAATDQNPLSSFFFKFEETAAREQREQLVQRSNISLDKNAFSQSRHRGRDQREYEKRKVNLLIK